MNINCVTLLTISSIFNYSPLSGYVMTSRRMQQLLDQIRLDGTSSYITSPIYNGRTDVLSETQPPPPKKCERWMIFTANNEDILYLELRSICT